MLGWWCFLEAWAQEERLVREAPPWISGDVPAWIIRYEDGAPMDTPTFLRAVDAVEYEKAYRRLQSRELGAGVGLASVGTLVGLTGLVLLPVSLVEKDGQLALAGGALVLGGYGVFSLCRIPFVRHARRKQHPAHFLTTEEADKLVQTYNEGLP